MERREHVRVRTPILVEFQASESGKTERTFTQDVSELGMRFPTAVKLRIGQELPVAFQLPPHEQMLRATGEVMWIREVSRHGGPHYEVGVRFRWVEDPDQKRLRWRLATFVQQRV